MIEIRIRIQNRFMHSGIFFIPNTENPLLSYLYSIYFLNFSYNSGTTINFWSEIC